MSFLDKFFRKQKEERLEKESEKQQKETAKVLEQKTQKKPKKKEEKVPIKPQKKEEKPTKAKKDKKESVKISAKSSKKKFKVDTYDILVKPLITEKVSDMAQLGKYAFEVKENANKIMVKKAVSTLYDVNVRDVKIINVRGKNVRYGRQTGKRKNWKKAIVTLQPGEKIEVYEGV